MAETTPTAAPAPAPAPAAQPATPVTHTPLLPLIITLAGAYLAWFGVHYWRSDVRWPTDPIKAVLTGKPLPDNTRSDIVVPAIYAGPAGATIANTVGIITGNVIAQKALQYKGAGYVWGGNASSIGQWDCSSFVSKVLGQDCQLPLPGGKWGDPGFPPHSHGPTTLQYMLFGTGISQADVRAGDLIVSVEHIGIAISPTQMISAQSPASGTEVSNFPAGFPSGPPIYRRVTTS
jgi:hypothetical protein